MKNKVTAILLAGGKGTRFDPDNLKTLHMVKGRTLTEMVIHDIKSMNFFNEIVLVYNQEYHHEFSRIIAREKIIGAQNGASRFFSAFNGIQASNNEHNLFIDVAAPFYRHELLIDMAQKLTKYDGVMSTIFDSRADHVHVEGEIVQKIFKRGQILRVKSYQAANKSQWLKAVAQSDPETLKSYSEMLAVLVSQNFVVGNVMVSGNNPHKITTKEDLRLLQNVLEKK